jgi:hypothetical protein
VTVVRKAKVEVGEREGERIGRSTEDDVRRSGVDKKRD